MTGINLLNTAHARVIPEKINLSLWKYHKLIDKKNTIKISRWPLTAVSMMTRGFQAKNKSQRLSAFFCFNIK